ncbi:MAG: serine/threonine protein kinase [Akkermansia sp.]|nr:serine/threonine protein kinase [Akkermansia sp.]
MDVVSLPPGTIIGNYKILKAQGQGGFGITYIAWDRVLERNVAMKECFPATIFRRTEAGGLAPLRPELEDMYAAAMADMRREAMMLAKLSHPGIVPVYDVFEARGSLFYVMPWLGGGSLAEVMEEAQAEERMVDAGKAQDWLLLILDALVYLHGQGVIHRDLKPANIMFNVEGNPVLIDFGSARQYVEHSVSQGEFSWRYAAPEHISGKGQLGPWTDLYSLATTWYELLSGCDAEDTVRRLQKDELIPLHKLEGMNLLPGALVDSIMRNMELKPEARCETAAQWRDWLRASIEPRSLRRRKRWVGIPYRGWLLACSCVMLMGGIGLGLVLKTSHDDAAPPTDQPDKSATPAPGSPEFLEKLYKDYCAVHAEALSEARQAEALYERKSAEIVAEYEVELEALGKQAKDAMRKLATASDKKVVYLDYLNRLQMLEHKYEQRLMEEVAEPAMELLPRIQNLCYEPARHYAGSMEEMVYLPRISDRLTKEFLRPISGIGLAGMPNEAMKALVKELQAMSKTP